VARAVIAAFAAWTLFVWATRMRNLAADGGTALDWAIAVGMLALGVAVLGVAVAWRRLGAALVVSARPVVGVAAAATVVVWLVRTPPVLLDDGFTVAFRVVHAGLAAVSVALAAAAWWAVTGVLRPEPEHGRRSPLTPGAPPSGPARTARRR
jgi:hypothetical protein